MKEKFSRAFMGYKGKDVEQMLTSFRNDSNYMINDFNKEKKSLLEERARLEKEIEYIEAEMSNYRLMRKQIEAVLYQGFMDSCQKVYETEKQFDDRIERKTAVLKSQQDTNYRIKSSTNSMLEQLRVIVEGEKDE